MENIEIVVAALTIFNIICVFVLQNRIETLQRQVRNLAKLAANQ